MHYKITIEYDGTGYCGWQRQPKLMSVQGEIEKAIKEFSGEKVDILGAGRTDAGVHAYGQVAHFSLKKNFPDFKVAEATNHFLRRKKIVIVGCEIIDENFHARFSAKKKQYEYLIINRRAPLAIWQGRALHIREELDIKAMQKAAKALLGKHDFTSFRDSECQAKSPIRSIDKIIINKEEDLVRIRVIGKSFLHHQVRIIVGTLKNVGVGKWDKKKVKEILLAKDRTKAGETSAACGLYLKEITY
jgi:tRNA pseudouridine38-40 synthase